MLPPNTVKYWNGSSWKESADFSKIKMWTGTSWRTVEFQFAGAAGANNWNIPYGYLDSQRVTVGFYSGGYPTGSATFYGYIGDGKILDGTSNLYSGATINELYWWQEGAILYWSIAGNYTNTGWTTMKVGSTNFSRSSATFSSGGGTTSWTWNAGDNPFGSIGSTVPVVWS